MSRLKGAFKYKQNLATKYSDAYFIMKITEIGDQDKVKVVY